MRDKKPMTFGKLYSRKKLIISLTGIFGILSAIIIIITYYGQNVGSFSIKLSSDLTSRSIFLSTDESFQWYDSRLDATALDKAQPISARFVTADLDTCKGTDGSYVGANRSYVSYTFYLKNMGSETVDISKAFTISRVNQNLDEVIWLYFIEDGVERCFQKEDKEIPSDWPGYLEDYPETTKFKSDKTVLNEYYRNMVPNQVIKYTLVLWLESLDPDYDKSMDGGSIRFSLSFGIYAKEEEAK